MVTEYLDARPDPALYDFLMDDFEGLETRHGGVVATSFRTYPSYPQRFIERLPTQPACDVSLATIEVEPWQGRQRQENYTESDLLVRQFFLGASRQCQKKNAISAA